MKQLVSILIPAFNAEQWIGDCLESALAQTWPRKEIIVVDDGSRDSTLQVARCYTCANVQVTTQRNRGASAARNHALSLAQGDYIQWLDADDLLAPDKIARQLNDAEPGQYSSVLLSGAWSKFFYYPMKSKTTPHSLWRDHEPLEWLLRQANDNLWMALNSWLVSRKLTEMAGPWNENLSLNDDGDYICRVVSRAKSIRFIPEAKCYVRRVTSSVSSARTLTDGKLDSQLASIFSQIRSLRSMEDSQRVRAACLNMLQSWYHLFYPERPDSMRKMKLLATELGGSLHPPELRPKYRLLQKALGWRIAKKAMFLFPHFRFVLERAWERVICLPSSWKKGQRLLLHKQRRKTTQVNTPVHKK